jgi:L-alanine-DL-glutamate epimerase-like enolase superfamily enzyme
MKLGWERVSLHTTLPFVISRWGYSGHENVIVSITDDGITGMGEAAPNRYYNESANSVVAALEQYTPIIEHAAYWSLEATESALLHACPGNASARAALSSALHDLYARRLGVPLHRMWGLSTDALPLSSFTIAIDDVAGLKRRVADAEQYPILKIKLGTDRDEEIVRTVRAAAPDKVLRVDANAAWTPQQAVERSAMLRGHGVESLEQPVAAADIEGLRFVHERCGMPVIADESCLVARDIPRVAGACDMINIKLAKCGSLREAMRMVHTARAHDLRVMAGCMIETSLGVSAIAQLAPLLDTADLDGAALLADDPFQGATIGRGRVALLDTPGLGVTRRPPA